MVEGCDKPASPSAARGMCNMHYHRWRRYGTVGSVGTLMPTRGLAPADRFWLKVDKNGPGGCWLWTAYVSVDGYGRFDTKGAFPSVLAHRIAYELLVGAVPEDLTLDHLCRMRRCVNPAHLEPVTLRENILRGEGPAAQQARRGVCIRGHDLTDPANVKPTKKGYRRCRACANFARMERYRRLGR